MNNIKIIIECMLAAYMLMKIRDYGETTKLIKRTIGTPQIVVKKYRNKLNDISQKIDNAQDQQKKLEQPTTYRNRQKLKREQQQLARLHKEQKGVEAALNDYQTIVQKMKNEDTPDIKQELRSYLRNKNRL